MAITESPVQQLYATVRGFRIVSMAKVRNKCATLYHNCSDKVMRAIPKGVP